MATEAQTAANQRNAKKSTGPRTAGGKAASRRNAMTHGLAGGADVLHDEDFALVDERVEAYRASFRPADACAETLVAQMAIDSLRLDRCRKAYIALVNAHAERAGLCWDVDRRVEAADLAAELPRDPEPVARRLEAFRQGCELLADRWTGLGRVLAETGAWTDAQRELALDLLGFPRELRGATTPVDPIGAADPREHRLALVDARLARLRKLRDDFLDDRDASEQALAASGLAAETSAPLRLLHRYESAVTRRWQSAFHKLTTFRRQTPAPPPEPAQPPLPQSQSLPGRGLAPPPPPLPLPPPPPIEPEVGVEPEADAPPDAPALTPFGPIRTERPGFAEPSRPMNRRQRRRLAKLRPSRA